MLGGTVVVLVVAGTELAGLGALVGVSFEQPERINAATNVHPKRRAAVRSRNLSPPVLTLGDTQDSIVSLTLRQRCQEPDAADGRSPTRCRRMISQPHFPLS